MFKMLILIWIMLFSLSLLNSLLIRVMAFSMPFFADSDPDIEVQYVLSKLLLIRVMAFNMPFLYDSDPDYVVQ